MPSYNPTVNIDLDAIIFKNKQFGKGARDLNKIMLIAIDEGMDELARRGEEYAKQKMSEYGITGELYNNLKAERVKDGIQITTHALSNLGEDYSMFVEFGTGIVGYENQHPKASMQGWTYTTNFVDSKGNRRNGWVYPSNPDDVNSNKWVGKDGNLYAFTSGQQARPFMYDTWKYLSFSWHSTLQGYINRARKEWGDELI